MSIAFETTAANSIQRPTFIHGMPRIRVFDSPEENGLTDVRRRFPDEGSDSDSSSSSSIGRNSDSSDGSSDCEDSPESEVQSSFKGALDNLGDLEEMLPIRKGMSKFYNGKSKSFTSLSEIASASSIKDFAKPETPYTRKRKILLAHNTFFDKNRKYPPRNSGNQIPKRPASSTLPPLHPHFKKAPDLTSSMPLPQQKPPCRCFSLPDLQCVEKDNKLQ